MIKNFKILTPKPVSILANVKDMGLNQDEQHRLKVNALFLDACEAPTSLGLYKRSSFPITARLFSTETENEIYNCRVSFPDFSTYYVSITNQINKDIEFNIYCP
jgi:hypothetical protein